MTCLRVAALWPDDFVLSLHGTAGDAAGPTESDAWRAAPVLEVV